MPTVLCIDDNAEALKIRKRMLETEGYSVLMANNGPVGLKLLAENSVDAVVLDYMMPEMDGLAVAMAIREHHGQVPILLLTGYPKVPKELLEIVNACVRKGWAADVLLGELERLGVRATKAPRRQTAAIRRRSACLLVRHVMDNKQFKKQQQCGPRLSSSIGMPVLNGIAAAMQIRKVSPESRIVFLTQDLDSDVMNEALAIGADGYVQKASAARELLSAIEAALGDGHQRQAPTCRPRGKASKKER